MKAKLLHTAFRGAFLLVSVSALTPARAQIGVPTPRASLDDNGVDLATGDYLASFASLTIGNGEAGMTWSWGRNDITRSHFAIVNGRYYVSIGDVGTAFVPVPGGFSPVEKNGTTLVRNGGTYVFTSADGDTFTFITKPSYQQMMGYHGDIIPESIRMNDGTTLTFEYETGVTQGYDYWDQQ